MVFSLSALWWRRIRGLWDLPDGRDWLRGKLDIVLMDWAMLSKFLIPFSVDGWSCVPSLLFTWGQTVVKIMSSQWCHPAISSSVIPFSSCPQSIPASESFPMSQLFTWVAKVLEFQLQHHSFQRNPRADLLQDGLVGSPCSPRDSQESSPTPQFKSINSLVLSFLHSPTLTSTHTYWKNHNLD